MSDIRVWLISVLWIGAFAGCDSIELPGKRNAARKPIAATQVVEFAPLYRRHCAGCHGADGQLGPAPPLNDPLFRAIVSPDELRRVVSRGRPATPMPAFAQDHGGPLTTEQVQVLADGISGVQRERLTVFPHGMPAGDTPQQPHFTLPLWGPVRPAPANVPPLAGGKPGDVVRGRAIFADACASCHGEDGTGKLVDETRRHRINSPAFLQLISDQALRRLIITGRPHLGMPAYADGKGRAPSFRPLTGADVADLVALLDSWRTRSP